MEQERQRLAKISRVCLESLRHLVDGKFLVLDAYHLSLGQLEPEKIISRSLDRATTSKSYAQMLAVLGLIAELLLCSKTISQRDVYYALKHMFRNQSECNKIILDIGMLLQLKRCKSFGILQLSRANFVCTVTAEMNIVPAAKGNQLMRSNFGSIYIILSVRRVCSRQLKVSILRGEKWVG